MRGCALPTSPKCGQLLCGEGACVVWEQLFCTLPVAFHGRQGRLQASLAHSARAIRVGQCLLPSLAQPPGCKARAIVPPWPCRAVPRSSLACPWGWRWVLAIAVAPWLPGYRCCMLCHPVPQPPGPGLLPGTPAGHEGAACSEGRGLTWASLLTQGAPLATPWVQQGCTTSW